MAKATKKKKKTSAQNNMLALFQHDNFSVFFLLSTSTLLVSTLYLMQVAA